MVSNRVPNEMTDTPVDAYSLPSRNLEAPTGDMPSHLQRCIAQLMTVSDVQWARFMYKHQWSHSRLHSEAFTTLVERHLSLAQATATRTLGALMDDGASCPRCTSVEALNDFNVSVRIETPSMLDKTYLHFAAYDPGRQIVDISESTVSRVERCISESALSDVLGPLSIRNLVLWHEYYHVWMRRQEQQRSADNKGDLRMWLSRRLTPHAGTKVSERLSEELGAILFSKMACGLDYNPQVVQWLLVYTEQPQRAVDMMKDILEESVIR